MALADVASDYKSTQTYIASQNLSGQAADAISSSGSLLSEAAGSGGDESQYYDNPESMAPDAEKSLETQDTVASLVCEIAQARARTTIDETSAEIKASKTIQDNADAITHQEDIYCSDGACESVDDEKNEDFATSITDMSALNEEASGVQSQGDDPTKDPNSIRLFTGRSVHCRDITLGVRNCCADSGWASGVVHCRGEEKDLGAAKEKGGLVVYTGRYCAHRSWGVCTEHKKGYCIFPSRIAYDIQVSGRNAQLGRGFGDAKNPNCSGLSIDDISRIDLDRVDLSNVADETVSKTAIPGDSDSLAELEEKIKKSRESESIDD